MLIDMDGKFSQEIERNRITINAALGSTITVTDIGPPQPKVPVAGPARIAIERIYFHETSPETEVDLERSRSGTTADLAYDHITGELKAINGAAISNIKKPGNSYSNLGRDDLPSENECKQATGLTTEWRGGFGAEDYESDGLIACIKTAESDIGYLVIWPDTSKKPVFLEFYSYVWVR